MASGKKFPTFPSVDLSKLDLDPARAQALATAVKDVGYVTVGLAVLVAQKAQVRRVELQKSLSDQRGSAKLPIEELVDTVQSSLVSLDTNLVALESRLDSAVEDLGRRLPERAGAVLGQAHGVAKAARQQLRTKLINAAG